MKKVKHIYTVNDKYSYETRHLVKIDDKNVVFIFNYDNELKSIRYKNIYLFAGGKKPNEMEEYIKNKGFSDLNLGLYEYFDSSKFEDSYYLNLYKMKLNFDEVYNKFNKVLNVIDNEVKENDTVLMFKM